MKNQDGKKEEVQSRYELMCEKIESYRDKKVKIPNGFIIPLKKSVVIKQVDNQFLRTTGAGILIAEGGADNSNTPMVGTIMAVGPECSEYLKPGLRVACNQYANLEIQLYGEVYIKMHEDDVHGVLPDASYVSIDKKDADEVRRGSKIEDMVGYQKRKNIFDANEKDKAAEAAKQVAKLFGKKGHA